MNAFIRQEISAVDQHGCDGAQPWKPARQQQGIAYLPIVHARLRHIIGYRAELDTESGVVDCLRRQIMQGPQSGLLLVDLNTAECLKRGRCHTDHMCALLTQEAWTDRELIVHVGNERRSSFWQTVQIQQRLRELGVGFAVDWDIRSSLLYLDTLIDARLICFDADVLKEDEPCSAKAVTQMLQIANRLGIQTLLTGVSDGEQAEEARRRGFHWLQGPLFNRLKRLSAA